MDAVQKVLASVLVGKLTVWDLAALLGLTLVSFCALRMLASLIASFVPRRSVKSYGTWAVVTGATDGIGKAYAAELAKRGLSVVLISRTKARLDEVATEFSKYRGVEVKTIAADFSSAGVAADEMYARIAQELAGLDIGVLVNNVGVSYPSALYFDELEKYAPNMIEQMIQMNVVSVTRMTHIVLKGMVERKRGAIINISSAAGRIPIGNPMYAEYSATKAYVDYFSRSLHHEYKGRGIHVQCQAPYFVATKLAKIRHASLTTPNPANFAKAAVNAIGGSDSVVPFWAHAVQDWVIQRLPAFILSPMLMNMHRGLRARYLKKLEKDAGEKKHA